MKFRMRKLLAALIFFASSMFCFADGWYICLGSFDTLPEAQEKLQFYTENKLPSQITEYTKMDGSKFYRIFITECYESKEMAEFHKNVIVSSNTTKPVVAENIWVTEIVQTPFVPGDPEKRILVIKDSDSGNPIADVNVKIDDRWNVMTNDNGRASLPNEIGDGYHSIYVTKGNEYVPTTSGFNLSGGEIQSVQQISIPKAVDYKRIKIVLDWGEYPHDLDSHVFSNEHHVYFSNKNSGNMNLDRDDTTSYGPETITIMDPNPGDVYKYYVYNYSDGGYSSSSRLSNSGAQITVIVDNEYRATYKVTPDQVGVWWHVFDVVNGNDIVTYDTVSNYRD